MHTEAHLPPHTHTHTLWHLRLSDQSASPDATRCCVFIARRSTVNAGPPSLSLARSAAVHPKYQEAEEHSDSDEGDGRGGGEELLVVDAEVPHHGQDHHKHGHHHAARAVCYAGGPEPSGDPGADPRLGPFLRSRLVQGLGDVAVDHAVVRDVEG